MTAAGFSTTAGMAPRILSILLALAASAAAFQAPRPRHATTALRLGDDLPEVEPGAIDWDDEFKKLKRGEIDTGAARRNEAVCAPRVAPVPPRRRARDRRKTLAARARPRPRTPLRRLDVERAGRVARQNVRQTTQKVTSTARSAARSAPKMPAVSSDAKFWFGVLVALSVFPLIVSSLNGQPDVSSVYV